MFYVNSTPRYGPTKQHHWSPASLSHINIKQLKAGRCQVLIIQIDIYIFFHYLISNNWWCIDYTTWIKFYGLIKQLLTLSSPKIQTQILQSDLHSFSKRNSEENLIKDQGIFHFMVILLIIVAFSQEVCFTTKQKTKTTKKNSAFCSVTTYNPAFASLTQKINEQMTSNPAFTKRNIQNVNSHLISILVRS